jgi:hypothetical protein
MTFTNTFTMLALGSQPRPLVTSFLGSSPILIPSGSWSSTALSMAVPLADYSDVAVQFFTSIRTPAALIAGSSLGAFFIMVKQMQDPEQGKSKFRVVVLLMYHILSLSSLLLSLNVIVISTSASNTLLIADYNPMATSAYEFLTREIKYEYITTRWCFYASIICFLKAIACRALLEFDLLRKQRIRSAMLVVFTMTAFIAHVLHIVNDCLYTYGSFWIMTVGVVKVRAS